MYLDGELEPMRRDDAIALAPSQGLHLIAEWPTTPGDTPTCKVAKLALPVRWETVPDEFSGPDPGAIVGFGFFGVMFLVARGAAKVRVAAVPEGLDVHTGWRSYRVPWNLVEGFWVRQRRQFGGVYVLIAPADIVLLPLAQTVSPARPNASQTSAMQSELTAYARAMGAPLASPPLDELATERLPSGEPPRRWEPK